MIVLGSTQCKLTEGKTVKCDLAVLSVETLLLPFAQSAQGLLFLRLPTGLKLVFVAEHVIFLKARI